MTKHINPQPFESKHLYYPSVRDSNFLSNVLKISEHNSSDGKVKSIFSWGNINYLCDYKDSTLHCNNTELYSKNIEQGQISLVVTKDKDQKVFVEITQAKIAPKKPSDIQNLHNQVEANTFGIAFLMITSLFVKKISRFIG